MPIVCRHDFVIFVLAINLRNAIQRKIKRRLICVKCQCGKIMSDEERLNMMLKSSGAQTSNSLNQTLCDECQKMRKTSGVIPNQ